MFVPLSRAHNSLTESKSADMLLWLRSLCNTESTNEITKTTANHVVESISTRFILIYGPTNCTCTNALVWYACTPKHTQRERDRSTIYNV